MAILRGMLDCRDASGIANIAGTATIYLGKARTNASPMRIVDGKRERQKEREWRSWEITLHGQGVRAL